MDGIYTGTPRITNALTNIAQLEQRDRTNALQQERYEQTRADEQQRFAQTREDQKLQRQISNRMGALNAALKAKTPDQAKSIYKTALPDEENIPDFSFVGEDKEDPKVSITYPDGSVLSGPKSKIIEATEQIAKDPTFLTDPENQRHLAAWSAAKGISFTAAEKEKKEEKPKEGAIRTFQKGTQTVTEEYKNGKWTKKAEGPKFKPSETSTEDKKTKETYEKMKRIEKILGEVDKEISLFAEINMDEMSEEDKATLLSKIEKIATDQEVSPRHRKLANEYLELVDTLYEKPATGGTVKPPDWRDYR